MMNPNKINWKFFITVSTIILWKACISQAFLNINNKVVYDELSQYDYYFLGETHDANGLASPYKEMLKLILQSKQQVCFFDEADFAYKLTFDLIYQKRDTNTYYFNSFRHKKEGQEILKYIYLFSSSTVIPIDYSHPKSIDCTEILEIYRQKGINNDLVSGDLELVKKANVSRSKKKVKALKSFKDSVFKHSAFHTLVLKQDTEFIFNLLRSFEAYILSRRSKSITFKSSYREKFMAGMIEYYISKSNTPFISMNGKFHIPLTEQKEWVYSKNWKSLACMIRESYPEKKVCSIYFMNRETDNLSRTYFPKERKYILENTKKGQSYFIILENDPALKNLTDKFQYIVIW